MTRAMRRAFVALLACVLALVTRQAQAQPLEPIEGRDYRIVPGPNAGSTYIEIDRGANIHWTEGLTKRFGTSYFDVRKDNAMRTIALCERSPNSFDMLQASGGGNLRTLNTIWNTCPEAQQTVYLIPGEILEITGVHYLSPEEEKKALDGLKELKDCTNAACVQKHLDAIGAKVKVVDPATTAPAIPPKTSPKTDPTPAPSGTASSTKPAPAASASPSEKSGEQPATTTTDDKMLRIDPMFLVFLMAGVGLVLAFIGYLIGRRARKARLSRDTVKRTFVDGTMSRVEFQTYQNKIDIAESERDAAKQKLEETRKAMLKMLLAVGQLTDRKYTIRQDEAFERLLERMQKRLEVSVRQREQITDVLDSWGVKYRPDVAFDLAVEKLKERTTYYRAKAEDGDALRAVLSKELGRPKTDDVTPLTELHQQIVNQMLANAPTAAAPLATAPTIVTSEPQELLDLREEKSKVLELMANDLVEYEVKATSDTKLATLYGAIHDEWKKRNVVGIEAVTNLLAQQAEDLGISPIAKTAALIAGQIQKRITEREQQARDELTDELAKQAEAAAKKAKEDLEDFKRAMSLPFQESAMELEIVLTDDTSFEDLVQLVLSGYRASHGRLLVLQKDKTRYVELYQKWIELNTRLVEIEVEMAPLSSGKDPIQFGNLSNESDAVKREMEVPMAELKALHHALTGVTLFDEALMDERCRGLEVKVAQFRIAVERLQRDSDHGIDRAINAAFPDRDSLRPPPTPNFDDEPTVNGSAHRNGHANGHSKRVHTDPGGHAVRLPVDEELAANHPLLLEMESATSLTNPKRFVVSDPDVFQALLRLVKSFPQVLARVESGALSTADSTPIEEYLKQPRVEAILQDPTLTFGRLQSLAGILNTPLPVKGQTRQPPRY